jgi:VanZ family protein
MPIVWQAACAHRMTMCSGFARIGRWLALQARFDHWTFHRHRHLLRHPPGEQMHRLLIDKRLFILRRVAFLGCITALATLAWLPASTIARTALGGQVEHLIAYLGTTIVVGMAYPTHPRLAAHSVLLIGYAAILEVGQLGASGRHASFGDFAFSAAGVGIGGLCLWTARARRWARPIARERA